MAGKFWFSSDAAANLTFLLHIYAYIAGLEINKDRSSGKPLQFKVLMFIYNV